jgi:hypothetical protein
MLPFGISNFLLFDFFFNSKRKNKYPNSGEKNRSNKNYFSPVKNNFFFFFLFDINLFSLSPVFIKNFKTNSNLIFVRLGFLNAYLRTCGEGFFYLRGLVLIFFVDACLTDDEPL